MTNDIIFIGKKCEQWISLKERYPTAKRCADFFKAQKMAMTKMFWAVWPDVDVSDDFDFSYQVDQWNTNYVHVFKNGNEFDGIILCNKRANISEEELETKLFADKKEIDILASTPKAYDVFYIASYDDYYNAYERTGTSMFWTVPSNVSVVPEFMFDFRVPKWDKHYTHVFRNGEYFDGIVLHTAQRLASRNEFFYSFFVNRKEVDIQASAPLPFDVVFISYNESNADENYKKLLEMVPTAKRVHGVAGIHQAHIEAANQCSTNMFWVVDGDADIVNSFDFGLQVIRWEQDCVYVWRSQNPINDLSYGYGGVKLLPTELTKQVDVRSADMTTSISNKFKAMPGVSNITVFNTDAFSAWRSAFRECVKLASNTIRGQIDEETKERLDVWCTAGRDRPFGKYAISGALLGREYGNACVDITQLSKINDYDWLYQKFTTDNANN